MDCLEIRKDAAITILVVWPMKERIMLGRPIRGISFNVLGVPNSLYACNIWCSRQISRRATIPRRSSLFITYASYSSSLFNLGSTIKVIISE
jgi:hypothetical protein